LRPRPPSTSRTWPRRTPRATARSRCVRGAGR
jgi:hypothetical protein